MALAKHWSLRVLAVACLALLGSCGGGGSSGGGNPGGGGTSGPTAPGAPTIAQITIGDTILTFTLSAGTGSAPTGYSVTCVSGIESHSASASGGNQVQLTGLTNGVPLSCSATASNSLGQSPASPLTVAAPTGTYPVATALPEISITTDNGLEITSKDDYVTARIVITDVDGTALNDTTTEIKGRGNSTWLYDKKPYRVKPTSKAALLGMPSSRHWVLLANYLDKTLVRNETAFEFGEAMGFAWTPRTRPVVVKLNGSYRGIYDLAEHVRIDSDRVDIPELKVGDTAPDKITGGYLMEIDSRRGEDYCMDTPIAGVIVCHSNPETLLEPGWEQHKAYIDQYITDAEAALYSAQFADPVTGYAAYFDVDAAVDWYLHEEFFKNVDSNFFSSVYLHKPRGGKLTFGPLWDFDLSIGNANHSNYGDPTGWKTRTAPWFTRLFEDPAFADKVKARWKELRANGEIDKVFQTIDRRAAYLSLVQVQNFERWPVLNSSLGFIRAVNGPYDYQVFEMKYWLVQRRNWIDAQFQ